MSPSQPHNSQTNPEKKPSRIVATLIALVFVTSAIFIAGNFLNASMMKRNQIQKFEAMTLYPRAKTLGEFKLQEQSISFTEHSLKGEWHLLFMGYTNCPHICPTEMTNLSQLYQKLPANIQQRVQVIMVTTDPLRDTPEKMTTFVKQFHADFIGLSGTKEQIAQFAKQFSMPFLPANTTDKNSTYEVNHSATIYLTNPQGQLYALFTTPHDVNKMQADIMKVMSL